jgi:hypothetical protein
MVEHLTVDQVVEGILQNQWGVYSSPFAHPIDVGKYPRISTIDPIYGIGTFILKETYAPFVRHFIGFQRCLGEKNRIHVLE